MSKQLKDLTEVTELDDTAWLHAQVDVAGTRRDRKISRANLLASLLSLTVDLVVADDTARFLLTTDDVAEGDVIRVNATDKAYSVTDDANLDSEAGYTPLFTVLLSQILDLAASVRTAAANPTNATGGLVGFGGNIGAATATSVNGVGISIDGGGIALDVSGVAVRLNADMFIDGSVDIYNGLITNGTFSTGQNFYTGGTFNISSDFATTGTKSVTLAFGNTGSITHTFPATSSALARTDAAQTFAGVQTVAPTSGTNAAIITGYDSGDAASATAATLRIEAKKQGVGSGQYAGASVAFRYDFGGVTGSLGGVAFLSSSISGQLYVSGNAGSNRIGATLSNASGGSSIGFYGSDTGNVVQTDWNNSNYSDSRALTRTQFINTITGIADATNTRIARIIIPNGNHAAVLKVFALAKEPDGTSGAASNSMEIAITRVSGSLAVCYYGSDSAFSGAQALAGLTDFFLSCDAVGGTSGGENYVDIIAFIDGGASAKSCFFSIEILNYNASGIYVGP